LTTDPATLEAFAVQAQAIAKFEELDGQPVEAYRKLVKDCDGNMRMILQRIEGGEMLQ
jgi:hypothetical protein